jgi:hypothetical protein
MAMTPTVGAPNPLPGQVQAGYTPTTSTTPSGTAVTSPAPVDTSGFTSAQLAAYNHAASLAPVAPPTINGSNVSGSTSVNPPLSPAAPNYNGAVANGNATIAANNGFIAPNPDTTGTNDLTKMFQDYLGSQTPPPSSTDLYNNLYNSSGVNADQAAANAAQQATINAKANLDSVNAQLQGLTADKQAADLQISNRLAPTFIISAAQAQSDKQYAIKALPLQTQALTAQAQVAAAQGNETLANNILTQAQNHLDNVFKLQSQDMQAQYQYMTDQRTAVYNFATTQEKAILDQQQKANDQAFTQYQNNLSQAQSLAKTALSNGQGDLATSIASLDPNSSTFQADLAKLEGQISAPASATKTSTVNVNGRTLLINSETGATIKDLGASTSSSGSTYSFTPTIKTQLSGAGETSTSINQLEQDIGQYGAQYVLDNGQGLSDATKQVIESTFGISPTPPAGTKPWWQFWG